MCLFQYNFSIFLKLDWSITLLLLLHGCSNQQTYLSCYKLKWVLVKRVETRFLVWLPWGPCAPYCTFLNLTPSAYLQRDLGCVVGEKKWDTTCCDTGFFEPHAGSVTINIPNSQIESNTVITAFTCWIEATRPVLKPLYVVTKTRAASRSAVPLFWLDFLQRSSDVTNMMCLFRACHNVYLPFYWGVEQDVVFVQILFNPVLIVWLDTFKEKKKNPLTWNI